MDRSKKLRYQGKMIKTNGPKQDANRQTDQGKITDHSKTPTDQGKEPTDRGKMPTDQQTRRPESVIIRVDVLQEML